MTVPQFSPELEIIRSLGEGKSACVYLARETALDRLVAVKVLSKPKDDTERLRFEREAKATAALHHPNVVSVYRVGRLDDDTPYFVMQYVKGRTVAERAAAEGLLNCPAVRRILADAASGLAEAHAAGIVHREIKPENLVIDEEHDRVLVTDFGLARLTESWRGPTTPLTTIGQVVGDVRYASPEQLRGEPVTAAADVYSLALVALDLLREPRRNESRMEIMTARLAGSGVQVPDSVRGSDPRLASLLQRCLAADPKQRPSAAVVAREAGGAVDAAGAEEAGEQGVLARISRKRMPQWVVGTAASSWLLLEVVNQLEQQAVLPAVSYPIALVTAISAVLASIIVSWFHGERGTQKIPMLEKLFLAGLAVAWLGAIVLAAR